MEIEAAFAAAIADARRQAIVSSYTRWPLRACDFISAPLANLWADGQAALLSNTAIQSIVDRYVEFDDDGLPWPRHAASNVVSFRSWCG